MYFYNIGDDATPLERMVAHLRAEHRLKLLTDYSYTCAGDFAVMCHEVWKDDILEHCKEYGIQVDTIITTSGKDRRVGQAEIGHERDLSESSGV